MGQNSNGQLGDGTYSTNAPYGTNRPEQILAWAPLAGYNHLSSQLLAGGDMRLSFVGLPGTNYALDRSFSLRPTNWVPQVTNPAGANGGLVLTNTPNKTTNNFWRLRSVP
jgi:hypothetical protein